MYYSKVSPRRFAIVVALAAFGLRVYRIGHQSLWVDEILTLIASTTHDGYSVFTRILHNIHGPLHSFVVYAFQAVSQNAGWMRTPGALAGAGSAAALYYWVRRWIGETPARVAAILFAVNPLHVYYSQELRNYAFVVFFALLANVMFERMVEDGTGSPWKKRSTGYYALSIAAALLSNFSAAFLLAAHTCIWFVRMRCSRRSLASWGTVAVMVAVLTSPWIYRVTTFVDVPRLVTPVAPGELDTGDRLRGETTFTPMAVPYALFTFSTGFTLGPSLRELHTDLQPTELIRRHAIPIGAVSAVFGVLSLLGILESRRRRRLFEMGVYLVLPFAFMLALNWQNAKAFNARYVLVALPAWLVLLALGLLRAPTRLRVVLGGGALAIVSIALFDLYAEPRYAREDVRSAVAYIAERDSMAPCVLAPTVAHVAQHYAPEGWRLLEYYRAGDRRSQVARAVATCNTLWYIRARPWVDDPDGFLLAHLLAAYPESQVIDFPGVKLLRLAR